MYCHPVSPAWRRRRTIIEGNKGGIRSMSMFDRWRRKTEGREISGLVIQDPFYRSHQLSVLVFFFFLYISILGLWINFSCWTNRSILGRVKRVKGVVGGRRKSALPQAITASRLPSLTFSLRLTPLFHPTISPRLSFLSDTTIFL